MEHAITTTHTEFKLALTVWSLEGPECQPCPELQAICELLEVPELLQSPVELYPSTKPIRSNSDRDPACFLEIDIDHADPTDQMELIWIQLRCANAVADRVEKLICEIRSRSEVSSALLRGNLGLS